MKTTLYTIINKRSSWAALLLIIVSGCQWTRSNRTDSAEQHKNNIVSAIVNFMRSQHSGSDDAKNLCTTMRLNLIGYITAKSGKQGEPLKNLKEAYKTFSGDPNSAHAYNFWNNLKQLKPILFKLQTDIIYETQEVLSHANPVYKSGMLGNACPLIDSFLRQSFDDPMEYATCMVDLLDLAPTSHIDLLPRLIKQHLSNQKLTPFPDISTRDHVVTNITSVPKYALS